MDDVVLRRWADSCMAAFIVVTTFLVLFVLLRSVVPPIKALVMNMLSIVASFGALVGFFQDGTCPYCWLRAARGSRRRRRRDLVRVLFRAVDGLRGVLARGDQGGLQDQTLRRWPVGWSERPIASSVALIVVVVVVLRLRRHRPHRRALASAAIAVALDATIVRALLVPRRCGC